MAVPIRQVTREGGTPAPDPIPCGPGLLEVPPVLAGTVELNATQMVMSFEPDKQMVGKALFVELPVEKIEVSGHHVAVRLPGGIFDQEYEF